MDEATRNLQEHLVGNYWAMVGEGLSVFIHERHESAGEAADRTRRSVQRRTETEVPNFMHLGRAELEEVTV